MQDHKDVVERVIRENGEKPGELPAELIASVQRAEALLFIYAGEDGVLRVQGTVKGGNYQPGQVASHAYMAAVYSEHGYLLDVVNGRINDALRYRALRDFAMLANVDPARFEVVSGMLHQFEESENLADEKKRTEADFVRIADFMVHALLETDPAEPTEHDEARIAAAEDKRERKSELRLLNSSGTGPLH